MLKGLWTPNRLRSLKDEARRTSDARPVRARPADFSHTSRGGEDGPSLPRGAVGTEGRTERQGARAGPRGRPRVWKRPGGSHLSLSRQSDPRRPLRRQAPNLDQPLPSPRRIRVTVQDSKFLFPPLGI